MKKQLRYLLPALLLLGLGLWYSISGRFQPLESFEHRQAQPLRLSGQYFKGQANPTHLHELFRKAHQQRDAQGLQTPLVACFFTNPAKQDSMHVFIGYELPAGVRAQGDSLQLAPYRSLAARTQLGWSAPNPDNIFRSLEQQAQAQKLKPKGIYLEKYLSEAALQHEILVE